MTLENDQALGATGNANEQTLVLFSPVAGTTSLTLTFSNGTVSGTTPTIIYQGNGTDASTIQADLNTLLGTLGLAGSTTVVQSGVGVFDIIYNGIPGTPTLTANPTTAGTAVVSTGGGTVVGNGASLQLQGDITVAGEPLVVQGSGIGTTPALPQAGQWFAVGPAPITDGQTAGNNDVAGRVENVAVDPTDPNTMYIATAGGGAWKTTDGGLTWHSLFDDNSGPLAGNVAAMFTGYILLSPTNPREVFLGTGEADNSGDSYYGTGVYVSQDSGQTWTLLTGTGGANPLYGMAINKMVIDPATGDLYVATSNNAVNDPHVSGEDPGIWRLRRHQLVQHYAAGVRGAVELYGPEWYCAAEHPRAG